MKRFLSSCAQLPRRISAVGVAASILLIAVAGLVSTANAGLIAMDDFSNYIAAPTSLNGQAGVPVPLGFTGTWTTPASTTVVGGVLTTGAGDGGRSYRPFGTPVTSASGTLSISFVAGIPSAFGGIEFAPTANDDTNSIRVVTSGGNMVLQGKNGAPSKTTSSMPSTVCLTRTPSTLIRPPSRGRLDPIRRAGCHSRLRMSAASR